MTITLEGGVTIAVYIIQLFLSFCQILFPYQDSHMQIICRNPAPNSTKVPVSLDSIELFLRNFDWDTTAQLKRHDVFYDI